MSRSSPRAYFARQAASSRRSASISRSCFSSLSESWLVSTTLIGHAPVQAGDQGRRDLVGTPDALAHVFQRGVHLVLLPVGPHPAFHGALEDVAGADDLPLAAPCL